MKKFITLCSVVLLAVSAVTLSAQERIDENNAGRSDNSLTAFEPPALIVRKGVFGTYTLQDGTSLKYRDLRARLLTVPENGAVLRRADGWRIATWATLAVMAGATVTGLVYTANPDWPHAKEMAVAFEAAGLSLSLAEMLFWNLSQNTMDKAVDNYNLSVMGIPVPLGKK